MNVLVSQPRYSEEVCADACLAWMHALGSDSPHEADHVQSCGSLLTASFNLPWAMALDAYERGHAQAFAMIHADVGADAGWLDVLLAEMDRVGADVLSVVVPIKDSRGLTSTAVDDTGDLWRPRRLTTAGVQALPETFTDEDVAGPLLLNTGLWACRLGPWALDCLFRVQNRIVVGADSHGNRARRSQSIPEDWDFSRQARASGARLAATRKVPARHYGRACWNNWEAWGWDHDRQNAPREASCSA